MNKKISISMKKSNKIRHLRNTPKINTYLDWPYGVFFVLNRSLLPLWMSWSYPNTLAVAMWCKIESKNSCLASIKKLVLHSKLNSILQTILHETLLCIFGVKNQIFSEFFKLWSSFYILRHCHLYRYNNQRKAKNFNEIK